MSQFNFLIRTFKFLNQFKLWLCLLTAFSSKPQVCKLWYPPLAVEEARRMRLPVSLRAAMASSYAVCGLHIKGTAGLGKCLQKVDLLLNRNIGTSVVAARGEALRKDESGSYMEPANKLMLACSLALVFGVSRLLFKTSFRNPLIVGSIAYDSKCVAYLIKIPKLKT